MKNFVLRTVANLSTLYPHAGYGPEGVQAVSETWTEVLIEERVTVPHFRLAVNQMIKTSKYFPTIAEILKEINVVRDREYDKRQRYLCPRTYLDSHLQGLASPHYPRDYPDHP